uniref:tripartite motif-containing protein 42-like n=1 Tax=Pristiophorus japonicus TaxID=55135 RepID=UPI00398F6BC5
MKHGTNEFKGTLGVGNVKSFGGSSGEVKDSVMDAPKSEYSKIFSSEFRSSLTTNEEAAEGMEGPSSRKDTSTNFVCWKSPNEEQEICYPSSSQAPANSNAKNKKRYIRPPIYDELTCRACGKVYDKPLLLPCNHSICERCILKQKETSRKSQTKHSIITCPICRENHYFNRSEKVQFPENFMLTEVLTKLEKLNKKESRRKITKRQVNCQLCETENKQIAIKKCVACNQNFCKECLKQHNKTYTDHDFTEPAGGEQQGKCFQHLDSNLSMFCMSCKIPICDECSKEKHKDHPTSSIKDAFNDQSIHLFQAITQYGKAKDENENDMLKLSVFKSKLHEKKNKFQKYVSDQFVTLHELLTQKEKAVKEKYNDELNVKIVDISRFMEASAKRLTSSEGLVQYAKEAVKEMNELVLLQTVYQLIERLRENVATITISAQALMTDLADANNLDFIDISDQINQIFIRILNKSDWLKKQEPSPSLLTNNKKTDRSMEIQQENKEALIVRTPSYYSQEKISESQGEDKGSTESIEHEKKAVRNISENNIDKYSRKKSQAERTNLDAPMPPTIYHHIVQGNRTKKPNESLTLSNVPLETLIQSSVNQTKSNQIFWMVPQNDLVDSFNVHLQEIGANNGAATPLQVGVTFSGIEAASFETALKANSEALFRVRAVSAIGESDWSYPYKENLFTNT